MDSVYNQPSNRCGSAFRSTLVLVAVILCVFSPCLFAGFLNWDDPDHLLNNPFLPLRSLFDIPRLFFAADTGSGTYNPLVILSFGVERLVGGLNPFIFHLDNVILHILTTLLVRSLAVRMGLSERGALIAALVFAIHPMRVESVAWVTERKDVLFGLFYIAALVQYWEYIQKNSARRYIFALICAVASSFSKLMAYSLPFILLLIDWKAGRRRSMVNIIDKVPFIMVIWPVTMVSVILSAKPLQWETLQAFLLLVFTAIFYVVHFFFPFDAATIYPVPRPVGWHNPAYAHAVIACVFILCAVFVLRKNRWVVFAFSFYILSIFAGFQLDLFQGCMGIVKDRFMYVPGIGFAFMLGAFWDWLSPPQGSERKSRSILGWIVASSLCAVLAVLTFNRCLIWGDSLAYWNSVLRADPNNTFALVNRAAVLLDEEDTVQRYGLSDKVRYQVALKDLQRAVHQAPRDPDAWNDLGIVLDRLGRTAEADVAFVESRKCGGVGKR